VLALQQYAWISNSKDASAYFLIGYKKGRLLIEEAKVDST